MRTKVQLPLLIIAFTACSRSDLPTGISEPRSLEYSNAAIMVVATALGHDGGGYFDNAIACARRGVVEYIDLAGGRQATFTGCDTGNDVILEGVALINGQLDENNSAQQTLNVTGTLSARVGTGAAASLGAFAVKGITFSAGTTSPAQRVMTTALRVNIAGVEAGIDSRTSVATVLTPADMTIGRLPNAANSVNALSTVDMYRLAVRDLMLLHNVLFGEQIEGTRPAHQHVMSCGTVDVAPDPNQPAGYVRLTNSWNSCALEPGVLVSGTFQQTYDTFSQTRLAMRIVGSITLGGGIPVTSFSSIEWALVPGPLPGNTTISGKLVANGVTRTFSYTVSLDD